MQELHVQELEDASGGLMLVASLDWMVGGPTIGAISALAAFIAAGGAPDYSRTTPMGDMY